MAGRPRKSSPPAGDAGRMLSRLKAGLDVRRSKVRRLRAKLRDHSYVNLLKLDVAAQRLADEIIE